MSVKFNPFTGNFDLVDISVDLDQPTLTNRAGASTVPGYVYLIDPDNDESFIYSNDDKQSKVAVALSVIDGQV